MATFMFLMPVAQTYFVYAQSVDAEINPEESKPKYTDEQIRENRRTKRKPIVKQPQFELSAGTKDPRLSGGKVKELLTKKEGDKQEKTLKEKGNEEVAKRTPQSATFNLKDGTGELTEISLSNQNYTDGDGSLKPIVSESQEDTEYENNNKVKESWLERLLPGSPQPQGFMNTQGTIKAHFETFGQGGIRMSHEGNELVMTPKTSEKVKPKKVVKDTQSYIEYRNVWDNTDLVYTYEGTTVKESIVLNAAPKSNKFVFDLKGARASIDSSNPKTLQLDGVFKDKLAVGELTVSVNKRGLISEQVVKQYPSQDGSQIIVELDESWLNKQSGDSFPIVIDPPIHDVSTIPGGNTGEFTAYKSDGYVCSSWECNVHAGGLIDNDAKYWRTLMRLPYDQVVGRQILQADLYLPMMTTPGWHGTYDGRTVYATWAYCSGYNCISGAPTVSAVIGADGVINATPLVQWMIDNVSTSGYLIIWGEEWNTSSFKEFYPSGIQLHMYTNQYPSAPSPELPSSNASVESVVTTTEPQLRVSGSADPNGDPVDYQFVLKSTDDSVIWTSGFTPSRQVIIPEGVLQDGGRYKWDYLYKDSYWISSSLVGGSFRVDLLTGKDKSQTYQKLGPVEISMNNGNVYTSANTHSMASLGGQIGLSLEYNSPYMPRKGLEAQYYDNTTLSGSPKYRRIEPNIDYNWDVGSPAKDVIPSDNFSAKWEGYFIAPVSGEYYFGSANDDNMAMTVGGTSVFNFTCCQTAGWSTTPVYMDAGDSKPIVVTYTEFGGGSYATLKVKGAVPEQVVPTDWLRTKPVPTDKVKGLTGHYYYDDGSHNPANLSKFLVRDDPMVNFNWGVGAPTPGAPVDNFYVRWEGYFTAPTGGTYKFGIDSDDGARVTVDSSLRVNAWSGVAASVYDTTGVSLAANQTVPIIVEYYELGGGANIKLLLDGPGGVGAVDPNLLSKGSDNLPAGWNLSGDADGSIAYERVNVRQNGDVLVYDSDGSSWLFTSTGTGYTSPKDSDAILSKNTDGTFFLTDSSGRVYVFNVDGTLQITSTPSDDKNPAALKYEYVTQNGKPKLKKIIDQVNPARYGTLYYQGDAGCEDPYDGLDPEPPSGMLCGFGTTDGRYTKFMYMDGHLVTVSLPGDADMSFAYDANGTLAGMRDVLAEDAVWAGSYNEVVEGDSYSWIWYDELGRGMGIETPRPTPAADRIEYWIDFLPNASKKHTHLAEPQGYSQYIEYDNLLRTTKNCDSTANCTLIEYDPNKDLILSTQDQLGLKTTTIYNDEDLPIKQYGPAPAAWFGTDRLPDTTHLSQVPATLTSYDESLVGPAVAYYSYEGNVTPSGKLFGAPKLHATGIGSTSGTLQKNWATAPITPESGREGWGVSLTGKLRLPAAGQYTIQASHDDGVKIWIDDKLIVTDWVNGAYRTSSGQFTHNSNEVHRFRAEYYNVSGSGTNDSTLSLSLMQNGGTNWGTDWSTLLKPGYGLVTTSTEKDAQVGDSVTNTTYSDPAYGLLQNKTLDASGLAYQSSATYESPGTGYLRQLAATSPGGTVTQDTYWGALSTADNPCTTGTESFKQAGFPRYKINMDPDGAGSGVARQTETIYDDSGRPVAKRIGSEAWTCTVYDDRGRIQSITVPTVGARAGRTITYNYANSGNPLATRMTDASGYTVTTIDILGRTVKYRDVWGNVTNTTYTALGLLSGRDGKLGTESYVYDSYARLEKYKLDGVILAQVTYDAYGRASEVEYPTIKDPVTNQKLKQNTPARDSLERTIGVGYTLPSGSTLTNSYTISQSGRVLDEAINGVDLSPGEQGYQYDAAGRLTVAKIAGHSYSYNFTNQNAACSSLAGNNANSGKNSNRLGYTADGVSTWYCYDYADRLIGSSDNSLTTPTYDSHGNVLTIGTGTSTTTLTYDQNDRNTKITQGTSLEVSYIRDPSSSVVQRSVKSGGTTTTYYYGYSGGSNYSFMYTNNTTKEVLEKYITLPGGVMVTLRPTAANNAAKTKLSIKNMHGDTISVINGDGVNETGILVYEPFGKQITATTAFSTTNPSLVIAAAVSPANAQGSQSFGWAGSAARSNETIFAVMPMQMGARLYLPTLGRFLQIDPVMGGTENSYVYPCNPLNSSDYSGLLSVLPIPYQRLTLAPVIPPQPLVVVSSASYATWGGLVVTSVIRSTPAPPVPSPVQTQSYTPPKIATVNGYNLLDIKNAPKDAWRANYGTVGFASSFNIKGAIQSSRDYAVVGGILFAVAGCIGGAILTAGAAIGACMVYGAMWSSIGTYTGVAVGGYLGGTNSKYSNSLDMGPDNPINFWSLYKP